MMTDARRASIILVLSLANDHQFILQEISEDDPHGRWIHLEKRSLPDTALETARLYRRLLDIRPRKNESPDAIINRKSGDHRNGARLGNPTRHPTRTQGEKPLTFKEASGSITRLIGAQMKDPEMEDPEIHPSLKTLAARSGNNSECTVVAVITASLAVSD
jgi:hypothetical protein